MSDGPPLQRNRALSRAPSSASLILRIAFDAVRQELDGAPAIWQPLIGSQESCVQVLLSLQFRLQPRTQRPLPLHASTVQTLLSTLQGVVAGWNPFAGQV